MAKIKVVRIPKRVTWTSHIEGLEVGQDFYADYVEQSTICPLISGKFKLKYPIRVVKTEKVNDKGKEYLRVYREEDTV
jgi:hypothetical protein